MERGSADATSGDLKVSGSVVRGRWPRGHQGEKISEIASARVERPGAPDASAGLGLARIAFTHRHSAG